MSSFPITRYLVPSTPMAEPPGYTVIDQSLTGGLPAAFPLNRELTLVLGLATGLAESWQDADPLAVISTSADEWLPYSPPAQDDGPAPDTVRAAVRIILIRSGAIVAAVPAVAGRAMLLPAGGDPALGTVLDLLLTAWVINAGSVVGTGDYGSRVRFGWRIADAAVAEFMPPPIDPNVISLLNRLRPTQSTLGSGVKRVPGGFGLPWRYIDTAELGAELPYTLEDEYLPDFIRASGVPSSWELF